MKEVELKLLEMWDNSGITEVYKYKNRIKAYREPLTNIELVYDVRNGVLFQDIDDIANYKYSEPKDYKVSVKELIKKRN